MEITVLPYSKSVRITYETEDEKQRIIKALSTFDVEIKENGYNR